MSATTERPTGAGRLNGRAGTFRIWLRLLRDVRRERWGERTGYLFILPGLLLFVLF